MTDWPLFQKPKPEMTITFSLTGPESLGVFVILSVLGVICLLFDQFPAEVSFSREFKVMLGIAAPQCQTKETSFPGAERR